MESKDIEWILCESMAVCGCLAAVFLIPWAPGGILVGLVWFWAITLHATAKRLAHSRLTTRHFTNLGYKEVKCKYCTQGAQYLNDGVWGKIPHKVRIVKSTSRKFNPPQANVRTCPSCQGLATVPALNPAMPDGLEEDQWPPEG